MAADLSTSVPEGLRATGAASGVKTFAPWVPTGDASLSSFNFDDVKNEIAAQRAQADALRGRDSGAASGAPAAGVASGAVDTAVSEAAPPEFQYYGDSMFGLLPEGYDTKTAETTGWKGGKFNFEGIDKGWEDYEQDWQAGLDPNQYRTAEGISDWDKYVQAAQAKQLYDMEQGMNLGYGDRKIVHSIANDPRDPYGYGADYGQWYNATHGKGALEAEAERYAKGIASGDPAFTGYEQGYGKIDWNDADQVEDWFRRANMGGTRTANEQSRIAQNARTDLTEGLIMSAVGAGIGGMAGIGGLGSAWSNAQAGIGGLGQYG